MTCPKCKKETPQGAAYCPWCGKKLSAPERKHRKRTNGMGTIFKHPGNREKPWEAQLRGYYVGTYSTKAEAEEAIRKVSDLPATEFMNLTFSDVYDKWLPEHSRRVSEKGIEGYRTAYTHCEPLYEVPFRCLRTADFQEIINEQESEGKSKSSCEKLSQLFGQLSDWAIREGITKTNYARFLTINARQKATKAPFTTEQLTAISGSKSPAAQIARILIATGCRPNELFSVTVDNCHENYFVSGSKTEAGRNRVIPVTAYGLADYTALRQTAAAASCRRLVEAYPGNHAYANFAKRDWKALMEELKIEGMTPYNCRHTYTTRAVQAGMKPEILQKILGHANYNTTVSVYSHLGVSDILEESNKIPVTVVLQTHEKEPKKEYRKS